MENAKRYKLVRPDAALAQRGLRVLVGGSAAAAPGHRESGEIQAKVEGFLAYAQAMGMDIRRQILAMEALPTEAPSPDIVTDYTSSSSGQEPAILGMCLWVPSPGKTAMLFVPSQSDFPETAAGSQAAIVAALHDARQGGVVLVQAMMEPGDGAGKTVFAGAGLSQLATLTYMERKPPLIPPADFQLPVDLKLLPYESQTHGLFRDAIMESYRESRDCPALSGMRNVDDVIEGHKAVGCTANPEERRANDSPDWRFDPYLWGVLVQGAEKPVGCLLLAEIAARRALELVYLGLCPEVRGLGLGRLLMQRVLAVASRRQMDLATLAVDAANDPAVKLYRRCGYTSVAQRVAMIKRLN